MYMAHQHHQPWFARFKPFSICFSISRHYYRIIFGDLQRTTLPLTRNGNWVRVEGEGGGEGGRERGSGIHTAHRQHNCRQAEVQTVGFGQTQNTYELVSSTVFGNSHAKALLRIVVFPLTWMTIQGTENLTQVSPLSVGRNSLVKGEMSIY